MKGGKQMNKQVLIQVDEKLKRKFFAKLAVKGKTAKDVLTEFIIKWVKK